jgi:hypothetical protein
LNEARAECGVVSEVTVHDFDRYATLETEIGCDVNGSHSAAGNARRDLVSPVNQATNHRV